MRDWIDVVAIAGVLLISVVMWLRLMWVAAHETPDYDWRGEYQRSEQGEPPVPEEHLP